MRSFLPIFLLLFLLSGCDADVPATTAAKSTPNSQTAAVPKNTAGMGLTLHWPQPNFKTQKIPDTAKTVQIEITETGTFNNLYRTTIDRSEVSGDQTTRQIRIDMQGKSEREVLLLVTAKNDRSNVVAKGEKIFTLKAGVRNAVELTVSEPGGTVIIGGGGGGGGSGGSGGSGGGNNGGGTPVPTPIPTLAPTTYTVTPLSSTIYFNIGETVDLPIKVWNGRPLYSFLLNAKLPEGIDLFRGDGQQIPESPEGTIPNGNLSQSSDTIYLRGTVLSDASNLSLNLVSVIDADTQTTSKNYQILIRKPQIIPNQVSTPRAGEAFTQAFKVVNSVGPYTWNRSGVLPPGLSFSLNNSDTVTLSGTPDSSINGDTYTFTLQVTDGKGRVRSQTYVLGCGDGALADYRDAQPVVNIVSPRTGSNAGSNTITLTGERFTSDSAVLLDQVALDTTFVNSTTLQAVVPTGVKPGRYDVLVINPDTSVGRIEGGLALAYTVTDGGGFVSAPPTIAGLYARNTPVTPEVTNQELEAQLLTLGTTQVGTIDRDDPNNAFVTMLVVGTNFTPETRVFTSSYDLPSVYVNASQILVIVPVSQLFHDLQSPHNRLVVVNENLEKSAPTEGVFSLATNQATLEGPGNAYLAYVYPQKGPADRDVTVNVRGCGFERPHAFRISTIESNLERSVETSISAKTIIPAYFLFPSTIGYDLSVFGVNQGERFLSNTAARVYTPISEGLSVSSCEPNNVGTGVTKGINVFGSGFIPGMQVSFLLQNSDAVDNEFPALATTTAQTNAIVPLVSAGMPAGEYRVKVTAPDSDVYPGGQTVTTPGTCLTLQDYEPSNPVINSISPATVSNNEETPFNLTINGSGFFPGAEISIGAKTVTEGSGNGTGQILISSNNFKNMLPGVYDLYVQNVDGRIARLQDAITVTDGGVEVSNGPQITNVVPQYDTGQYFYSLVLGIEQGKVTFNVGNIAPGALAQLVEDPSDPLRPDEAYLSRLVISGNAVSAFIPNLPGGTVSQPKNYYIRMVNPDGQYVTSPTAIKVVNAGAPEIETNTTILQENFAYNGCRQATCPSRGPQNQPVSIRINGVLLNSRTPNMNFGQHPANSSVELVPPGGGPGIPLENVRTYSDVIYGTVPDALVPGVYRVRVINPDGQTNDVTNSGAKQVNYEVYASSSKWDKSGRMLKDIISGIHGRSGASVTLDPDTQKMYFFGGNDARTCYNLPTRRLLSYSKTSGWEDLGDDRNTPPPNTSDFIPESMLRRSQASLVFKNAASSANDKLFMFGGLNYSAAPTSGTCPYGPTLTSLNVLNDIWMYNVTGKNWEELALDTTQVGNPLPAMVEAGIHWSNSDNALYIYGGILSTGFPNNSIYKVVVNEITKKYTWTVVTATNALPSADVPSKGLVRYKVVSDPQRNRFFILGGANYSWNDNNSNGVFDAGDTVSSATLNDNIFMYDVAKNKWAKLTQSGTGYASRFDFSASIDPSGQKLYVYGGRGANCSNAQNPNTCSRKDLLQIGQFTNFAGDADAPPSLSWSTEGTVPVERRSSHVIQWADNGLYLFGGIKENGEVALFLNGTPAYPGTITNPDPYHDPATDFWQYIP